MRSILDPKFKYTPSAKTDVKATFARIRRELEASQSKDVQKVTPLKDRKHGTG